MIKRYDYYTKVSPDIERSKKYILDSKEVLNIYIYMIGYIS